MTHRITKSSIVKKVSRTYGFCRQCDSLVPLTQVLGAWRCEKGEREKDAANRLKTRKTVARRRKSPKAILSVEGRRKLSTSEIKVLCRDLLSKVCRERDNYTCYVTGQKCEPGVMAWQGQAAHLIPINRLPPELRYDPRVVKWMCGSAHSDFDGNTNYGKKSANQAFVWGKLAREEPELFEFLTTLPRQFDDKFTKADWEAQLYQLREEMG